MISGLLILVMLFSSSFGVFAANNTKKDESRTSSAEDTSIISTINAEQLTKQNLTTDEKEKIKNDYNYLTKCKVDVDLINDIEVVKDGKNVYKIEYPNNIKESITIEYKDGTYIMDVSQGKNKSNNLVITDKDIYLDGNKIEVQRENVVVSKEEASAQDTIIPMADRDRINTLNCPYGSSADYNDMQYVESNFNVPLTTMLKNITVTTLSSILGYVVFVGMTGAVASGIASGILTSFSGSTSDGLSYKNYVYYHKDGHYIQAVGGFVEKNNVRWYEKINYGGSSTVIPTYSIIKYY
ncbi:hypothetical protein [Geosporobacter ferrireducens]|uniref:hypothetical protein n=1 Tax=Geosporobacter ferrireducens TaxID=1424294 RepID=UPI00139B2850|nr:hypothetical protein [Geosporobacter ferrireducens]MTI53635.1 hypothetical protein [Geosporobacter ferrireducens]